MWILLALLACANAPGECPPDSVRTTECSGCGPTDACLDPQEVCAEVCEGDFTACDDAGGLCVDGLCLHNVCG